MCEVIKHKVKVNYTYINMYVLDKGRLRIGCNIQHFTDYLNVVLADK